MRRLLLIVLVLLPACHRKPDAVPAASGADETRAIAKAVGDTDAARREAARPLATTSLPAGVEPAK